MTPAAHEAKIKALLDHAERLSMNKQETVAAAQVHATLAAAKIHAASLDDGFLRLSTAVQGLTSALDGVARAMREQQDRRHP